MEGDNYKDRLNNDPSTTQEVLTLIHSLLKQNHKMKQRNIQVKRWLKMSMVVLIVTWVRICNLLSVNYEMSCFKHTFSF